MTNGDPGDQDREVENQVEHDGFAMLAALLLSIALIIYVGYNVI